jgi:hypothetical protein
MLDVIVSVIVKSFKGRHEYSTCPVNDARWRGVIIDVIALSRNGVIQGLV